MIKKQYKFNPPLFSDGVAVDPSSVFWVVKAVIVIGQGGFFVVHLAGLLDGLYEATRTGHGPIGGVIVSRRDRSLCVEDLRHILVEVHAVAVQGSALREGQGAGGHRFQRVLQQYSEHSPIYLLSLFLFSSFLFISKPFFSFHFFRINIFLLILLFFISFLK